jgi:hypothetical protein
VGSARAARDCRLPATHNQVDKYTIAQFTLIIYETANKTEAIQSIDKTVASDRDITLCTVNTASIFAEARRQADSHNI